MGVLLLYSDSFKVHKHFEIYYYINSNEIIMDLSKVVCRTRISIQGVLLKTLLCKS